MRFVLLPLAIVVMPQIALSIIQLGIPVLAPVLIADLGLAPEAVGIVVGCMGFGSIWMFAANHAVTPVLGPVRALICASLLSVFGASLLLTATTGGVLCGAVLIGFAYAITAPAGSQILSDHVPKPWWGTVFSFRMAGVPLGGAIAGLAGTGIAITYGWQYALAGLMVPPLICAATLIVAPARFRGGGDDGPFRLTALFQPSIFMTPFQTLQSLPQLRALTFASMGFAAVQGSVFSFFTTYMTDGLGLGLVFAGSLFATMQVVSVAGRLSAGMLADRIGAFIPVLIFMSLGSAASCGVMAFMDGTWPADVLFALAGLIGLVAATWNGLFLAEIARVVPAVAVGQATAGATFFTFLSYMIAPPIFALVSHLVSYQVAFVFAGCAALSATAFLVFARRSMDAVKIVN